RLGAPETNPMRLTSRFGLRRPDRPSPRRPAAQRPAARLRLEALEDRATPSTFNLGWAFHVGGPNLDAGDGIATNAGGNVYVAGFYNGPANFDPLNPAPAPSATLPGSGDFEAAYSPGGSLLWATGLSDVAGGMSPRVAVQGANVYVAYLGGSDGAVHVASLDAASGAVAWTVPLAAYGSNSVVQDVAVAAGPATGNVYVTAQNASSQAFVTQLASTGAVQWTRTTTGGTAAGTGVAVYDDPGSGAESVYLTGNYSGTTTFGTVTKASQSGSQDVFAWKLNADGSTAGADR